VTDLIFRRASRCEAHNCCLVALESDAAHVADSKLDDHSPVISFGNRQWSAFIAGIKAGQFDLPGGDHG
jgi:hypothetical protein